jgi:hypothetical protein
VKYGTHIQQIGVITPPTPPTPMPLPQYVIINTTNLGIHNTPQSGATNLVGYATLNTKWYPYELVIANGAEWYRVGNNIYIDKHYTRLL